MKVTRTTFSEIKIGQEFYKSCGQPCRKLDCETVMSLCPEYIGFDFQEVVNDRKFKMKPWDSVYFTSN